MTKKYAFEKGFTLAEVMIVLTVIGVLTAILLPVARQSMPDEDLMKFKKAHNTLGTVIRELVTSDKYYCNGDLGIKADCETEVVVNEEDNTYFCQVIADVLNAKKTECNKTGTLGAGIMLSNEKPQNIATGQKLKRTVTQESIIATKSYIDEHCIKAGVIIGPQIFLNDGVSMYEGGSTRFGSRVTQPSDINGLTQKVSLRYFSPPNEFPANYADQHGFDACYYIFCVDIDGVPESASQTDCVNECPFGYGIRADGKILTGKRADEWLERETLEE